MSHRLTPGPYVSSWECVLCGGFWWHMPQDHCQPENIPDVLQMENSETVKKTMEKYSKAEGKP